MFFLLGGNDKKGRKKEDVQTDMVMERVKNLFLGGKFPVVTTDKVEGKQISKVLGLVCCRGYDSEEAFFGMASRAVNKGAHAIVGYSENVAFHPDGSKYFSCFGTAVMFEWEADQRFGAAALLNRLSLTDEDARVTLRDEARAAARAPVHEDPALSARDLLKREASNILGTAAPRPEVEPDRSATQARSVSHTLLREAPAAQTDASMDDMDPLLFDRHERRRRRVPAQ